MGIFNRTESRIRSKKGLSRYETWARSKHEEFAKFHVDEILVFSSRNMEAYISNCITVLKGIGLMRHSKLTFTRTDG